ncbi:unnamed protein product [Closterium sp. NIES-54]
MRPSTAPQRVPLPSPPASSLPDSLDPECDSLRAASLTVMRFLATTVTDPSFESSAASALVAELAACHLDDASSLVAESESASVYPPSVGGECALGTVVLEDRQEEFECFAATVPHLVSMLLAPEGDPDAPDIPTPRSYAEAIEGPYSSQWQTAMDTEMASWKSTFLHEEIWLRRPPGFTGSFPASTQWSLRRPVYGLRQAPREWHNTPRTTLAALGFAPSTADPSLFLRTDTTLPPFYVLVYVEDLVFATAETEALAHVKSELQKRHTCTDLGDMTSCLDLRITRDRAQRTITLTQSHMVQQVLQRFGFTHSSPQSTPLPTGHSLSAPPSNESVEPSGPYPELVGCLMKEHMDAAKRVLRYLCSTSGLGLVLGGWARVVLSGHVAASWADDLTTHRLSQGYTFSLGSGSVSWRSTRSSLVLSSSCEAEIYAGAMAAQELCWPTYLQTDLGEPPCSPLVLYVDIKAIIALCQEHRLEMRGDVVIHHELALPFLTGLVDPLPGTARVAVAVGSGAARGAAYGGAASGGAELWVLESEGAGCGGAEPGGEEPGGAEPTGVEPGGSAGASPRLSPQQLREWLVRRARLRSGATVAGGAGDAGAGGAGVTVGASGTGGTVAAGPGCACTRGTEAAETNGVGDAGAGDPTEPGVVGGRGSCAGGAGAGGAGGGGAGVGGTGAGGARAAGAGAVDPGAGASSTSLTPPLLCPPPDQSQPPLLSASPLPTPSPYTQQSGGLTSHCEPASRPVSPARIARRVPCTRPPPVPGTHAMALRPSSVPLRVPLHAPLESSLPEVPDPKSDRACAASPTVCRCLSLTLSLSPLDFAAACRLDSATALVVESPESESASPPSVGGECALGTDVLEDRQEDFECPLAAVPRLASMLLAPKGDLDAPDIPTPRSYAEAITGPYSSHLQAAMDVEMASSKSTGTYVDEVPPPGVNIVDGMWTFRVKRPPGSPPAFKLRYVARGFSQRQGVDYFQTFSLTPKMTTLRVLLHVAAQRDYELHYLDFSTAFLQGSLHEEIWLRLPSGFTGSFPAGTQWSLRRPVYGLRQAPCEWYDILRTTLAALGFDPSIADPALFLRSNTSYVLRPSIRRRPGLCHCRHRACGLPHVPDDVHMT